MHERCLLKKSHYLLVFNSIRYENFSEAAPRSADEVWARRSLGLGSPFSRKCFQSSFQAVYQS
jgi:hypothetical protein